MNATLELRRGLSLAEVLVATLIVGVVMAGALRSVGMSYQTRWRTVDSLNGPEIAKELMSEAMAMPYKDPDTLSLAIGPDLGESTTTRAAFDDVDDYNGVDTSAPKAKDGTAHANYTGWRCQVAVAAVDLATASTTSLLDTGLRRVTVTVTSPTGKQTQLVALRAQNGGLEQNPAVDTTAVTWLGASLKLGTATRSEWSAAPVANHARDAY